MAQLSLGGLDVVRAELVVPRVGVWTADLTLESDAALTAKTLLVAESGMTWTGTIVTQGVYDGRRHVRFVGGSAGLPTVCKPKNFRQVSLRTLLVDTLGNVGETLAPSSLSTALSTQVATYARLATSAASVVAYWASKTGVLWRVLPDGAVWLGTTQAAKAPDDIVVLGERPHRRTMVVSTETFALLPGHVIDGKTVDSLVYRLDDEAARATVFYSM